MSASAVGGKGKNGDINQVPYRVRLATLQQTGKLPKRRSRRNIAARQGARTAAKV